MDDRKRILFEKAIQLVKTGRIIEMGWPGDYCAKYNKNNILIKFYFPHSFYFTLLFH